MKTQQFLRGAAILTAAGIISKLLGAGYRIPFFRVVGSEGMGLYQMAYPIYTMLLAVSSAGIPVAVSKLVSECLARRDLYGAAKVFRVALVFIALVSGIASLMLFKGALYLAVEILHDRRAYYSIVAIAPAVFFVGVMSVFRGYFQGFQEMLPTACSQVLEQFVRVGTVLAGAYIFLPRGVEYAAAAATFGAVTGAAAGGMFLAGLYFFKPVYSITPCVVPGRTLGSSPGTLETLKSVVALSFPISLGGLVMPVMQTLDAVTVPGRLQLAGYTVSRAAELYGQLTGGAVTLVNLPAVLTISLAASLVPAVSGFYQQNNYRDLSRYSGSALRITVLVCLPAAAGLMVLAEPISDLLFKCPEAGVPLAFLAPAALFMGLHQTSAGILQGTGRTFLPVINLTVGAGVKLILNYTLTAIPQVGIIGAAIGSVCGFLIGACLNLVCVMRATGWRPDYQEILIKPAAAVTIMSLGVYFAYSHLRIMIGSHEAAIVSILAGALLYFAVLGTLGVFGRVRW